MTDLEMLKHLLKSWIPVFIIWTAMLYLVVFIWWGMFSLICTK